MSYLKNKRLYLSAYQNDIDPTWRNSRLKFNWIDSALMFLIQTLTRNNNGKPNLAFAKLKCDFDEMSRIAKLFVRKDMQLVQRADIVVAYLPPDVPTTGTHHEIINSWSYKNPTLLVSDRKEKTAIRYTDALTAADHAALFKTVVKILAQKHGLVATFMAKWNSSLPGCSGHIHQSLADAQGAGNLFHATEAEHEMSDLMRRFMAGQLALMREFSVMFLPTVNPTSGPCRERGHRPTLRGALTIAPPRCEPYPPASRPRALNTACRVRTPSLSGARGEPGFRALWHR